MRTSVYVVLQL